ncbi:hypothetical protein [Sphingopyxis sp.]|jgi:hypothetical protein|uniref:hypothetical protein n=1 Tax=Sphingopyxis sp. TaxID=1908224 RepID=UPI003F6FD6BA
MQNQATLDQSDYEWQRCRLALPRFGLLVDRYGVRSRLMWPGDYLVRRSRTFGRWIYRRPSS